MEGTKAGYEEFIYLQSQVINYHKGYNLKLCPMPSRAIDDCTEYSLNPRCTEFEKLAMPPAYSTDLDKNQK